MPNVLDRLKNISVAIVLLVAMLATGYTLYLHFVKIEVIVDTLEVPPAAGISPSYAETLTRNALLRVPSVIEERVSAGIENTVGHTELDGSCAPNFISGAIQPVLNSAAHRRFDSAQLSFEIPDIPISKSNFSLTHLVKLLKLELGIPLVSLSPEVVSTSSGFTISVNAIGPDNFFYQGDEIRVETLQNIETILANEFAEILAPDLIGALQNPMQHLDIDRFLGIASDVLVEEEKVAILKLAKISSLEVRAARSADIELFLFEMNAVAEDILTNHDLAAFSPESDAVFLQLSAVQSAYIAYWLNAFEQAGIEGAHDFEASKAALIELALENLSLETHSSLELLSVSRIFDNFQMREEAMASRIAFWKSPTLATYGLNDALVLKVVTLLGLVQAGALNDAAELVDAWEDELLWQHEFAREDIYHLAQGVSASIQLSTGNPTRMLEFYQSDIATKFPCITLLMIDLNNQLGRGGELNQYPPSLRDAVSKIFVDLENDGARSFAFYTAWGSFLSSSGDYLEAASKYRKARDYPGEEAWSLLNEGLAMLYAGAYRDAEHLYTMSLSIKVIPNAVFGLLDSQAQLGMEREFLQTWDTYEYIVTTSEYRNDYAKIAATFACNQGVGTAKFSNLVDGRSVFDANTCSWAND